MLFLLFIHLKTNFTSWEFGSPYPTVFLVSSYGFRCLGFLTFAADARDCTRWLYGHRKIVSTESWLLEKNRLLHRGMEWCQYCVWTLYPLSHLLPLNQRSSESLKGFAGVIPCDEAAASGANSRTRRQFQEDCPIRNWLLLPAVRSSWSVGYICHFCLFCWSFRPLAFIIHIFF